MTTSKNYRTEVRTDSDYDEIPSVAVFTIEEATAQRILKLSALVKDHGLYKVEEFDFRTAFLKSDAEDEIDEDDQASTEADCLNVSEREFWFSAIIKHTNVEIVTGRQSIAELESHFGLASAATEEAGKTAPVLNECFEGRFAGKNYLESIETGMVDIAPLTAIVAPGTQEAVEKARKRLLSRTWDVFYGPVFDQQGNLRIGRGENISDDELLARFDWFVEGVDGKIK